MNKKMTTGLRMWQLGTMAHWMVLLPCYTASAIISSLKQELASLLVYYLCAGGEDAVSFIYLIQHRLVCIRETSCPVAPAIYRYVIMSFHKQRTTRGTKNTYIIPGRYFIYIRPADCLAT
jgi:hypothetical protein